MIAGVTAENVSAFNGAISRFQFEMGRNLRDTLTQQTKLLSMELGAQTPPWENGTDGTSLAGKVVGEAAVREGIIRSITPVNLLLDQDFKNKDLAKLVKNRNYKKLNAKLLFMKGKLQKWEARKFDPSLHTDWRDRFAKYANVTEQKYFTLDINKEKQYIKQEQKLVGWVKSGWYFVAAALGQKSGIPAWIKKQFGITAGTVQQNLNRDDPNITFWNIIPVALVSKYNYAFQKRIREMGEYLDWNHKRSAERARLKQIV